MLTQYAKILAAKKFHILLFSRWIGLAIFIIATLVSLQYSLTYMYMKSSEISYLRVAKVVDIIADEYCCVYRVF